MISTIGQLFNTGTIFFSDGYRTKRTEHGRPGFRILRVADVTNEGIATDGDDFVHSNHRKAIGSKLSQPGDVLLTTKGTVGRVAIYPKQAEQVVYSPQLCFFRVLKSAVLHPRYLAYWFKSEAFKTQAARRANSTDMAAYINLRDISSLEITLPDIREQRVITEVLGALDDKIAANDHVAVTAQSLADALFVASLQQDAGTPITIGELTDRGVLAQGDGYRTKRAEHGKPGFRILRAGDVRNGRILPEGADFVSESYAREIGEKASRPNDIVMTTKGSVGRVAVVPADLETVVYSPQICYFRVLDEEALDRCYLAAWFRSADLRDQSSQLMFKSDMAPYINLRDIRSLIVPIPTQAQQRKQGELQRSLLNTIHAAHAENMRLERTRDELLPLLMSGKIRVREAEKIVEEVV